MKPGASTSKRPSGAVRGSFTLTVPDRSVIARDLTSSACARVPNDAAPLMVTSISGPNWTRMKSPGPSVR